MLTIVVLALAPSLGFGAPANERRRIEITTELVRKDDATATPARECTDWKISKREVVQAFKKMRELSSGEWGSFCYVYPCSYEGKAKYRGRVYEIEVNAGSFLALTGINGGKTRYFIQKERTPYFLAPCNCCEETR
jgi:hypothetical protein